MSSNCSTSHTSRTFPPKETPRRRAIAWDTKTPRRHPRDIPRARSYRIAKTTNVPCHHRQTRSVVVY
eukprot:scaffold46617_cov183-Amphora_coffeaeformis.AAC.1